MRLVPNSWGSLREFNQCHDAKGKFCATPGEWKRGREWKDARGHHYYQLRGFSGFKQTGSGPTPEEYDALLRYTNYSYRDLDTGDTKLLDKLIARNTLDQDATLYRVIRAKVITGYKAGDTFTERSFVSTTWNKRSAKDILAHRERAYPGVKRAIFTIHVKKGQPAFEVDQYEEHDEATSFNEAEYLLPRKTTYRVTKVSKDGVIEEVEVIR